MGRADGGAIFRENFGLGEYVGHIPQIAASRSFIAMQAGESLNDLHAAAMAMEVAEAADVHENVESERGAGLKSAQCFVVLAAMFQAQVNDFSAASGGQAR